MCPRVTFNFFSQEKETAPTPRSTFPAHYLEVFAESEVEEEMSDHVVSLLEEYKRKEGKEFAAVLDEHRSFLFLEFTLGLTNLHHPFKLCNLQNSNT